MAKVDEWEDSCLVRGWSEDSNGRFEIPDALLEEYRAARKLEQDLDQKVTELIREQKRARMTDAEAVDAGLACWMLKWYVLNYAHYQNGAACAGPFEKQQEALDWIAGRAPGKYKIKRLSRL